MTVVREYSSSDQDPAVREQRGRVPAAGRSHVASRLKRASARIVQLGAGLGVEGTSLASLLFPPAIKTLPSASRVAV